MRVLKDDIHFRLEGTTLRDKSFKTGTYLLENGDFNYECRFTGLKENIKTQIQQGHTFLNPIHDYPHPNERAVDDYLLIKYLATALKHGKTVVDHASKYHKVLKWAKYAPNLRCTRYRVSGYDEDYIYAHPPTDRVLIRDSGINPSDLVED